MARGNRVVSVSANKFRNHPDVDHENATVHAEVAAMKRAGRGLKGSTIYVSRVGQAGETRMSRPCPDCFRAILEAGIKEIVYTNEVGKISIEKVN